MARALRLQSAVDYLTTYGWAIIIIGIALSLTYFYLSGALLSIPQQCDVATQARCLDIALGSNSLSSTMQIVIINGQQYAVENTVITVNMINVGSYNSACTPYYVLPGGKILCTISDMPSFGVNGGHDGFILFNETVCTSLGTTSCKQHFGEGFNGTYTTVVSPTVPTVSCTMTANSLPSSASAGTYLEVSANVMFNGAPLSGATVNFTSSSANAILSPAYALTNANGTATIYVIDPRAEIVAITGNFISGCAATNTITFT
ncbi:MAG: Ig-like domain-containing protein [Candidatus Marsarchaeota archaeon]|nr:Ig-like domain-containing protein [Candidatus Marsarchaeota archaeon]